MLACEKLKVFFTACEKLKVFFFKTELSQKNLWPPRYPDLTPADFFLWGLLKLQSVQKYTPHNGTTQRRYTPKDSSRQRRHFGKSIPEFGETHSRVLGCERRPVSASIMSRSCFASFFPFSCFIPRAPSSISHPRRLDPFQVPQRGPYGKRSPFPETFLSILQFPFTELPRRETLQIQSP